MLGILLRGAGVLLEGMVFKAGIDLYDYSSEKIKTYKEKLNKEVDEEIKQEEAEKENSVNKQS